MEAQGRRMQEEIQIVSNQTDRASSSKGAHCHKEKLDQGRNIFMQAACVPAFTSSVRQGHCPTDSLEEGHLVYYYKNTQNKSWGTKT